MQEGLKKSIYVTFIAAILLIALLFVIVRFLPMKEYVAPESNRDVNMQFAGQAEQKCIALCQLHKGDINYETGPCLSDKYSSEFKVTDWACDIVNNPRVGSDNLESNQCKSVIKNDTNHFVEVDTNCAFVRKV